MGMAHLRIVFWGCDLAWFWQRLLFGGFAMKYLIFRFFFKMEAFLAGKSRKFAIYFAAEVTAVLKKKGESEVLSCNLWMVVFAGAGPDCVY